MSEDKYIGMDVHRASIVCAVRNPAGRCVDRSIIETTAEAVRDLLRGLSGTLYVTFEEGTAGVCSWRLRDLVSVVAVAAVEWAAKGGMVSLPCL
jgi:hypothetical protein